MNFELGQRKYLTHSTKKSQKELQIITQKTLNTKHIRLFSRPHITLALSLLFVICSTINISNAQIVTPPPVATNDPNATQQNITYNVTGGDQPAGQMPLIESNYFDQEVKDRMTALYGDGKVEIRVHSIEPEGGPTEGDTRILVRGGPFHNMLPVYPHPKCRFGSNSRIVNATYVTCTQSPTSVWKNEPRFKDKNETCIQCEDSPPAEKGEIVPFTVSLVGDFSDCVSSVAYRYYDTPHIWAFQPRLGLKDGETRVEVWGENFLNFDEMSTCNFGSVSVKAEFINSTRLICVSPHSDVVDRGIPFSVSFNKQQNTKENMTYYYYNRPGVALLRPNVGADQGGFPVYMIGQNMHPWLEGFNYTNTTFCNFQRLGEVGLENAGKVPAQLIDSTKVMCIAPPNGDKVEFTEVELTLNDQQYSDDNVLLFYIRVPKVFDVDPREGPTKGGTEVMIFGDRFEDSKNLTCKFGHKVVKGKWISRNQVKCVSPPYEHPGWVTLQISNGFDQYSTESVKYYYYETPEIFNITPTCGPVSGYTQITVWGKNFRKTGFGKAMCIFNETIFMNATIMETDIIKCDSPQLDPALATFSSGAPFYYIQVTVDGGKSRTDTRMKFIYYRDPVIDAITPDKGPVSGGTLSRMIGSGFQQEGVCNVTVRYGALQQKITNVTNFTDKEINITAPRAAVPARVVVSIALNGQQFINDKVFHLADTQTIYTYYQDVYITDYTPKSGPTSGKTLVKVYGMGFNQFKDENGKKINQPIWVRFIDQQSGQIIGGNDIQTFDQKDDEFSFRTPPAPLNTKAIMEISYNQHDWQKVIPPNSTHSYQYYNAPHITSITPPYGPVKSPNGEKVQISGTNFDCPDSECSNLMVRFGDPDNGIYVKGRKLPNGNVEADVPKYTKPDVLPVEVTFNGQDYTNDNQTYGFFDPFILDVQPRLIHVKGTTRVRLFGFGFVNSTGTYLKAKFGSNSNRKLDCNGDCIKMADYIDKSTIESPTFPQNVVSYADNGQNIEWDGMATEGCVYGNTFTENGIEIFYYDDPLYKNLSIAGTPANQEKPIFIATDFQWDKNDPERFKKYANFTCRFRNANGQKVIYTKAKMEIYPLGNSDENARPTHIKCNSPKWNSPEQVKLDISVNGQDYSGDFNYQFYDNLDLYRIYPMAGPNEGHTKVTLFGSGFSSAREDVYAKWGVLYTEQMIKEHVKEYIWNETRLIQEEAEKGNMILKAYRDELWNDKEYYFAKRKDYDLYEGQHLVTYLGTAPRLVNWNRTHGGPIYMSVGSEVVLNVTNYTYDENNMNTTISYYNKTLFVYSHSYVEYYYYQQLVIKKVEPLNGLARGGTRVAISGAWFKYKPEYGIVPHCKIGERISRAQFYSTVRIVCLTPPHTILYQKLPVFVSLNGFDWVDTGYQFEYQDQVNLISIYPTSGEEGTLIYITGTKFQQFSGNSKFKCKFTDLEEKQPPKYEYVYWKDNTTIQCAAPKGFTNGVAARVQVTFNGEDYSDNNFTFYFYKLSGVFPNSGPTDGSGGPILILGDGFRNEMDITCNFNGSNYSPIEVTNKFIKCPMPPANRSGETFPQRVDFIFQIDNAQKRQDNGFWYYDQITAMKMEPNLGPAQGRGIIDFEVKGLLKDYDYFWANPGCKIGDSQGKGKILGETDMNTTIIQCIVEDIELVDKDYYLPATVALNSYSWVDTDFKYVPYGILDLYPNSGPISGNTDVIIVGKGFQEELQEKAQCRFGVGNHQVVVPADILEYEKLLCRTPPGFTYPVTSELPVSVPVSISLSDKEIYNPWTESPHRFVFYQPPRIVAVEPEEIEIGVTKEIVLTADEDSEFLQPIPTYKNKKPSFDILCKFGRFKEAVGTYVNKTSIKCAIPSIKDDPDTIYRETVKVTVAQNGKDFDEDNSEVEVTFVGTGSPLGFWSAILATLLIGLLIVAIFFYCGAILQNLKPSAPRREIRGKDQSYVIRDAYDQFTSRAYTSGMMGRSDPSQRS